MDDEHPRDEWLFPAINGRIRGIEIGALDPTDEDDRRLLIEADHPDLIDDLDAEYQEVEDGYRSFSPSAHLALHEVIANQIRNNDPPETWQTAERLTAAGYERHEVLHMLASTVADELRHMQERREPFALDRYLAALAHLPHSWEEQRRERAEEDDANAAFDAVVEAVRHTLAEHGPLSFRDLCDTKVADADEIADALDDDPLVVELVDETRAFVPALLAGTSFTHVLTPSEAEGGFVPVDPDFLPLVPLLDECGHLHLVGGGLAEELDREDVRAVPAPREGGPRAGGVLVGPSGWLGDIRAGDLIGMRLTGTEVEVHAVERPAVPELTAARLRETFDRCNDGDGMPESAAFLLYELAVSSPALVRGRTLPPIGDLLAACGFETRNGHAAPLGTDWERFERVRRAAAEAVAHGLDLDDGHGLVLVLVLVNELYRLFLRGETDVGDIAAEVAAGLADPAIGAAFLDAAGDTSGEDLLRFLDAVQAGARRRDIPGLTWARSVAAGRLGDLERAEALLREVPAADPNHERAIEDLAWYASDRGDARLAVQLLSRLDDVSEWEEVLRHYTGPSASPIGRNDPCPCGSGRKHKHCCQEATVAQPLPERVRWLWHKMAWFVWRERRATAATAVAAALAANDPNRLDEIDEGMVASLVLFQDGTIDDFLALRGPLLPADERELASRWARQERSVYEVVGIERGKGLTLRDMRTGDVVAVRERLGSTRFQPGERLFAHVVPDGVGQQLVGGVVVVSPVLGEQLVELLDRHAPGTRIATVLARAGRVPLGLTV